MTAGEIIQDVLGALSIVAIVIGAARVVWRWLQKSKQREIDERVAAAFDRRTKEQEGGTPVEKELRRQLAKLESRLEAQEAQHRQEIAELRAEHNGELNKLSTEIDVLRGQLGEAYRTRPNAAGSN